jgi:hypothetical protein
MQEWTYYVATLVWQKRRTGGFSSVAQQMYVFQSEGEYTLKDGLARLGEAGYELVAVHPEGLENGGDAPHIYHPNYIYVFKKPKAPAEEPKP